MPSQNVWIVNPILELQQHQKQIAWTSSTHPENEDWHNITKQNAALSKNQNLNHQLFYI